MRTLALALALLSLGDAVFTLLYLQHHPDAEANPLIRWALPLIGPQWFVASKTLIVGGAGLFLARHKCRRVLQCGAAVYGVLLVYHLVLFFGGY